jgi:hypothetical protein
MRIAKHNRGGSRAQEDFFLGSGGFYSDRPASDQQDNPFQTVATTSQTRHWNVEIFFLRIKIAFNKQHQIMMRSRVSLMLNLLNAMLSR